MKGGRPGHGRGPAAACSRTRWVRHWTGGGAAARGQHQVGKVQRGRPIEYRRKNRRQTEWRGLREQVGGLAAAACEKLDG